MRFSKSDNEVISRERLRATSRMAGEIAHELNTPLGGILIYSHLLLEDLAEDDPHMENVVKINKLAHRCKIILQSLLDFAHEGSPHPKKVEINRVLNNVIGFLEDHILLRGISIETLLDPARPRVMGDENKLEQVFINLVINAAQSMDGNGELKLRTWCALDTKDVKIQCSDTGCGIDEKNIGRIFEPFFTTKEKGKGSGLGLSLCHGILEQHGGTITVDSERGRGTTFIVSLPLVQEKADRTLQIAEQGQ
ncbi:MAG: HAMP domain-containing sensor histidine kinase [Thermodesulfobacteriota bacterium]|nr:HAMP domain-containing sensor histidine kinase [Thermodesulfobacteriota bacterium]